MSWQGKVRALTREDFPFLEEMALAAFYSGPDQVAPPLAEAMENPLLACWIADWGRKGDTALIAEDADGRPAGAAWYRLFTYVERSYGFIRPDIPEVAIAVRTDLRGQGVGRVLLRALVERAHADGIKALSLSVDVRNERARRLYLSEGFREGGLTMIAVLDEAGL